MATNMSATHSIKQSNKSLVLKTLWMNSPISRTELANSTGLNKATITNIIAKCETEGLIKNVGNRSTGVGRSHSLIMFNNQKGVCIGVSIWSRQVEIGVTDLSANVLWKDSFQKDSNSNIFSLLDQTATMINTAIEQNVTDDMPLLGIGIGLPSLLDLNTSTALTIPSHDWYQVSIKDYLGDKFNVPIYVNTYSNAWALGEKWFGIGKQYHNIICITIGQGIGAGIIINDELFTGSNGFAGDLGHMTLEPNGPMCYCGKRGCWELVGAGQALHGMSWEEAIQLANDGNGDAIGRLTSIGRYMGIAISNIINLLNPDLVIIGGIAAKAGNWVMNPCQNYVQTALLPQVYKSTTIEFSKMGLDASMIGAATIVVDKLYFNPD